MFFSDFLANLFPKIVSPVSGNRWLRAQKSSEWKPLEGATNPQKRDKVRTHYFKILECCHFFAAAAAGTDAAAPALTLLTTSVDKDKWNKDASAETDENGFLPPKEIAENLSECWGRFFVLKFPRKTNFQWEIKRKFRGEKKYQIHTYFDIGLCYIFCKQICTVGTS
jgi:hypothetical protein